MDEYPERFYTRFDALLIWFASVGAPIWAAVLLGLNPRGWDVSLACALIALLVSLCLVCAGVMVAAYPIRIGESGIRSYDVWGRYFNVPWCEITDVERRSYVGFRFLRIDSSDAPSVLVTLRIRNPDTFLMRVRELA